ncbi:MAG: hypothetical protein LIP28_10705 [Deltaproteobacteria bacterium]|nr:hypothetical protein [Deltaproteobacteria bacterium]
MSKRKIGIIAGIVCLVAVAGVFGVKWQFESTVRADIEKFLAELPPSLHAKAEKIDVSFFDKSVILTNVGGTYTFSIPKSGKEESVLMTFNFARIAASGINMDGFKDGAGTAKLIGTLIAENATIDSPVAKARVERYVVENISADFMLMKTELEKGFPILMAVNAGNQPDAEETKQVMQAAAGILKAYETMHIGRSSITNYTYGIDVNGEKMDVVLESAEAKDYSIRKMGPLSIQNIKASYKDIPLVALETLSSDEIVLPSFVGLCEILAKDPAPMPHTVQGALKGQPFAVKNLRMGGLRVLHPMMRERELFSLADMNVTYAAEDAHTMTLAFDNLNIDKALVTETSALPPQVFAALPDTITLEGKVEQVTTLKEMNTLDLECKKLFLKGSGLGEGSLSYAVKDLNLMAMAMGMPNRTALKNFDVTMTDHGLSEVLFAIEGLHSDSTAAETRSIEVESLRNQKDNESSQAGKEILTGLISFLEKPGGTLRIAVAPEQAATVDQLLQAYTMNPAALGLTVTFTPGE